MLLRDDGTFRRDTLVNEIWIIRICPGRDYWDLPPPPLHVSVCVFLCLSISDFVSLSLSLSSLCFISEVSHLVVGGGVFCHVPLAMIISLRTG